MNGLTIHWTTQAGHRNLAGMDSVDPALVEDVALLSLDAGNTVVFLDHDVVAAAAQAAGYRLDRGRLPAAEGAAKRALDTDATAAALPDPDIPPTWSRFMATVLHHAGLLAGDVPGCTRALWRAHRPLSLWRRVPRDLVAALADLRASGIPTCVVSNAEGNLRALFAELALLPSFDLLVDSHEVGVEKPDPAIFHHVLAHFRVAPGRVLHIGDVVATDVVGARAAGLRAALLDPLDHYAGQHADVPRVPSAAAVARALRAARR